MTLTRGNIIIENIVVGDIHYEYDYGTGMKVEVITKPVRDDDGYWSWKSKHLSTGNIIDYGISEQYIYYGPKLYDYEAYDVDIMI